MALPLRGIYRQCRVSLQNPVQWYLGIKHQLRIVTSCNTCANFNFCTGLDKKYVTPLSISRKCSTQSNSTKKLNEPEQEKKPGLFKRFKQMTRDYWYVLLPVHGATSLLWFGGFYYLVRSGVDILSALEALGVSEKVITPIRDSSAGYLALAFACYKIVTPLRYAVTLGATTFAIRRLTTIGWIKPVPSTERIKEIIQEKRENIQDKFIEGKQHYQAQMKEMKEKRAQVMEEVARYKTDMRNLKDKVKKM